MTGNRSRLRVFVRKDSNGNGPQFDISAMADAVAGLATTQRRIYVSVAVHSADRSRWLAAPDIAHACSDGRSPEIRTADLRTAGQPALRYWPGQSELAHSYHRAMQSSGASSLRVGPSESIDQDGDLPPQRSQRRLPPSQLRRWAQCRRNRKRLKPDAARQWWSQHLGLSRSRRLVVPAAWRHHVRAARHRRRSGYRGAGGIGSCATFNCGFGTGLGENGSAPGPADSGAAPLGLGSLSINGFSPADGEPGDTGQNGTSGGGGGGSKAEAGVSGPGGGGGGAGGCGGSGGIGGKGGGSSIALVSLGAVVKMSADTMLTIKDGGDGGDGASGQFGRFEAPAEARSGANPIDPLPGGRRLPGDGGNGGAAAWQRYRGRLRRAQPTVLYRLMTPMRATAAQAATRERRSWSNADSGAVTQRLAFSDLVSRRPQCATPCL